MCVYTRAWEGREISWKYVFARERERERRSVWGKKKEEGGGVGSAQSRRVQFLWSPRRRSSTCWIIQGQAVETPGRCFVLSLSWASSVATAAGYNRRFFFLSFFHRVIENYESFGSFMDPIKNVLIKIFFSNTFLNSIKKTLNCLPIMLYFDLHWCYTLEKSIDHNSYNQFTTR